MVKHRMDLLELLRKRGIDGDVDLLREALRVLVDGIMDAEVSAQIGAQHGERSPERVTYRNCTWDTRVGTMELHIPKLREGSYFPSLLEPRRRSEKALLSVIQQAYGERVSTRMGGRPDQGLGCSRRLIFCGCTVLAHFWCWSDAVGFVVGICGSTRTDRLIETSLRKRRVPGY